MSEYQVFLICIMHALLCYSITCAHNMRNYRDLLEDASVIVNVDVDVNVVDDDDYDNDYFSICYPLIHDLKFLIFSTFLLVYIYTPVNIYIFAFYCSGSPKVPQSISQTKRRGQKS